MTGFVTKLFHVCYFDVAAGGTLGWIIIYLSQLRVPLLFPTTIQMICNPVCPILQLM